MNMKRYLLGLTAFMTIMPSAMADDEANGLQAAFTAQGSQVVYYQMGWDSPDEAALWTYSRQASGNFSWHLEENTPYTGQPAFSSIDPESCYSLCVKFSNYDTQNELATSPAVAVLPNSSLEFYACFRSVFLVYADWKFRITDSDSGELLLEWSAFRWAQEQAFTGPSWQKLSFDLSDYAGKNVNFSFLYTGPGGEDLAIDGLRLYQRADDEVASVTIDEGDEVVFVDTSLGNPTSWLWTFEGGQPATSTEQHPTVVYPTAGTYSVTLTIGRDDETSTLTREGYVNVVAQAPQALIGLPTNGYLSPWTALFIPTETTVQYNDLSSGQPTSWHWTFQGGDPAESNEQHPVVTYHDEGVYGMTLQVSNTAGTSDDFMKDAIQVGGEQYIWNIGIDEYDLMGEIALGWYGFYAGTNWLGMERFAEHFEAPHAEGATISEVQVYFDGTQTVSPNAEIAVQLCRENASGEPGDVLGETSILASEIAYDETTIVPTTFRFDEPIAVGEPFFVVIGPFPNNTDEKTGKTDAISILAVRRDVGQKSTTWHLLEDEDPRTFERLGTFQWFENTDDPISLCVTPLLAYPSATPSSVTLQTSEEPLQPAAFSRQHTVYDLQGRCINTSSLRPEGASHRGIFIVRNSDGTITKVAKR